MIKKLKKGFTLVELIVVIAIIAILSTVAVIGFTRTVDKANVSNDTQLVRNLNERMQLYEAENGYKKPTTAHEAFVLTEDFGFIIEKLTPSSSGNDIVWDSTTNRFALIDATDHTKVVYSDPTKDLSENSIDLWKVFKEVPSEETQKYSIYLAGENFTSPIRTRVGLDVGKNLGITEINYINTSGSKQQDVVIRTNSTATSLTINGPLDDVKHYGVVGDLTVTEVRSDHCYHEWGFVGNLVSFGTGKFVVESTALFHQTKAEVANMFVDKTDSYVEGKDAQYSQHIYNEDGICVVKGCNLTIKNGLVNGYYYKDDELFTGNENGYDFIAGNLVIKLDSKTYTGSGVVSSRTYNYEIESSDYLTKNVIIDGGNSSYSNSATINITDNSGKNYTVKSVQGKAPFDGLLSKNGWTTEDVNTYLMNAGGKALVTGGYTLTDANKLTGYSSPADDPDNYDVFIPKLCIDSSIVSDYFALTDCENVAEYYSKWQNNSLVITLADYLKLAYGKGYILSREGEQIKYSKSFGDAFESERNEGWQAIIEPDSYTGLPSMKLNGPNGKIYMTAPTKVVEGKLYFEDYVLDGAFPSLFHISSGQYLFGIEMMVGEEYYVTIYDDNTKVKLVNNNTEYVRFEIDQTNNVINMFINNKDMCVNGLPYSIPSSGNVTLVDGKVSLTGAFDVSNVNIPASAIGNLAGAQNSSYLMFEPALIEYAVKVVYQGLQVQCNDSTIYNLNNIPASVFSKTGNTLSCTFKCESYSRYNILNGVDIAGASYVIVLEAN